MTRVCACINAYRTPWHPSRGRPASSRSTSRRHRSPSLHGWQMDKCTNNQGGDLSHTYACPRHRMGVPPSTHRHVKPPTHIPRQGPAHVPVRQLVGVVVGRRGSGPRQALRLFVYREVVVLRCVCAGRALGARKEGRREGTEGRSRFHHRASTTTDRQTHMCTDGWMGGWLHTGVRYCTDSLTPASASSRSTAMARRSGQAASSDSTRSFACRGCICMCPCECATHIRIFLRNKKYLTNHRTPHLVGGPEPHAGSRGCHPVGGGGGAGVGADPDSVQQLGGEPQLCSITVLRFPFGQVAWLGQEGLSRPCCRACIAPPLPPSRQTNAPPPAARSPRRRATRSPACVLPCMP